MLTTLPRLKTELRITDGAQDAHLTALIEEQSAIIEAHCLRKFGRAEVVDTFRLSRQRPVLILTAPPVEAIGSVVEAGATLDAASYELESPASGLLRRLDGSDGLSCWPTGKIVVTYTAGYRLPGASGAGVALPQDIERACLELCVRAKTAQGRDPGLMREDVPDVGSRMYALLGTSNGTPLSGGLPQDIADRLAPYILRSIG